MRSNIMNIRNWLRAQYPHIFSDEKESVVLESHLCNLFTELRKKEETIMPRMSSDFDTRLANLLQSERIESPSANRFLFIKNVLENRNLQYSFSTVMLLSLVIVFASRYSSTETKLNDSAGVVIDNTSYLNEPTSIDLSAGSQKQEFINRLKTEPTSISGLKELETYYLNTGRGSAAEEIHYLIEAATER